MNRETLEARAAIIERVLTFLLLRGGRATFESVALAAAGPESPEDFEIAIEDAVQRGLWMELGGECLLCRAGWALIAASAEHTTRFV